MESNHPTGRLLRPAGFEVRTHGCGLACLQGFRIWPHRVVWGQICRVGDTVRDMHCATAPRVSTHIRTRTYDRIEMPARDPKHPVPFPFGSLTDNDFDLLVYLLAQAADPKVAKLRAPDGGLDTVLPSDADPLVASWGIQAKLHRQQIKWPDCKRSLERAVDVWQARRVTFAFPRDLTVGQHKLFHKHLTAQYPDVALDWWGASKLTSLLLESPAGRGIAKRFFHVEDPADLADRAIRAGGPLRTAEDLLEREAVTGEFLRSADPNFDWVATKRTRSKDRLAHTPGAVMRLEFGKGDQELIADAIPRSATALEHFAPRGALVFPDEAEWKRARELLEAVGSEGGRADLGTATVRLERIPAPFDELLREDMHGNISVRGRRPVPPWAATVSLDTDEGTESLDIDLVPEEPEDEWDAKLVGRRHGVSIELRFVWSHSKRSGELNVTWHFTRATGAAPERAEVLAFVIALHGTGTFEIRDREEQRPSLTASTVPAAVPNDLRYLQRVYEDLATIQRFAGATFGPPPDETTYEEAQGLAWLAQALLAGGYDGTMHSAKMRCGPEAFAAFKQSGNDLEMRETLYANFFGHELPIALQTVKLPLVTIKQAVRIPGPEPLWDIELIPACGDSAPVHFALTPVDESSQQEAA
jgi:hypothetical protein